MVTGAREPRDSRSARRLNEPRRATVVVRDDAPAAVGAVPVETVREEWCVVDRWWTERPVRRRYFDEVLQTGRNVVVFKDVDGGGWFTQRA